MSIRRERHFREVADEAGAEELEPGALGVADMAARRGLRPVGIALCYRLHDILVLGMRHRKPVRHRQCRAAKQDHRVAQRQQGLQEIPVMAGPVEGSVKGPIKLCRAL